MDAEIIKSEIPWEYYIVRRSDGTATGNVYLDSQLVYRAELTLVPEDYGYDSFEELPDDAYVNQIQNRFGYTLWKVLYDAQDPKERGQMTPHEEHVENITSLRLNAYVAWENGNFAEASLHLANANIEATLAVGKLLQEQNPPQTLVQAVTKPRQGL